jgi:hypothetical protein
MSVIKIAFVTILPLAFEGILFLTLYLGGIVLVVVSWLQLARLRVDRVYGRRMMLANAMLYASTGALVMGLITTATYSDRELVIALDDMVFGLQSSAFHACLWLGLAAISFFCLAMLRVSRGTGFSRLERTWRRCLWLLVATWGPCALYGIWMSASGEGGIVLRGDVPKIVQVLLGLGVLALILVFPVAFFLAIKSTVDTIRTTSVRLRRDPRDPAAA